MAVQKYTSTVVQKYMSGQIKFFSRTDKGHHPEQLFIGSLGDGVHRSTDVVQNAHDAWDRLGLNQLADHLVVEIVDRHPLDAFLYIFFLQNISTSHGLMQYASFRSSAG